MRIVGKFLMSVSVGVLLFVSWFLWGTGVYTAQQQERLAADFQALPVLAADARSTSQVGPGPRWRPAAGEAVFRLEVPALDMDEIVVEGVSEEELKSGPGHYPSCRSGFESPLCSLQPPVWPGQEGRVIVSGHRTTYGAPFWDLDKLKPGDEILLDTKWGSFTYIVSGSKVIPAESTELDLPTDEAELALVTCTPKYSASHRLVVFALLDERASSPAPL